MFCTQSFSIRFKRKNGAQKFAHSFGCLLVEKEERQNSNCGVNFSQRFKRKGALFCRSERSVPSIIFCVKFEEPTIFLGVPSSQKCHRKASLFLRRTEIRSLLLFCEECEVPKILEFVVAVFNFCGFYK